MESQPSLPSIIVISDSEDPCDVHPDECLRGEGILPRETEVDSANARKRRRLTLNSSSDGLFADIAGADDTASDPVEDDCDSDSDGFEFEFESADNGPLRSHPGDCFVQFVTSAFPKDDAHAKGKAFEGFLLNWFLVTPRVSKQVREVVVLRGLAETQGRHGGHERGHRYHRARH